MLLRDFVNIYLFVILSLFSLSCSNDAVLVYFSSFVVFRTRFVKSTCQSVGVNKREPVPGPLVIRH